MEKGTIDFAPQYYDFLKSYSGWSVDMCDVPDRGYDYHDYGIIDLLEDAGVFLAYLNRSKEAFIDYIKHYFETAVRYYEYYEYEYPRFGNGFEHFRVYQSDILYLCHKYYKSINDDESSHKSSLLLLCSLCYGEINETIGDLIEDQFEDIKEMITDDWLTVHPQITYRIGEYYLKKENYKKAHEYFKLGSLIDYEGRQSIDPFIEVGKNKYELGLLYLQGKGVNKDYEKALEYFEDAAGDIGEGSLPIIGDMYYEGLVDGKPDYKMALRCYYSHNQYNDDKIVNFKYLNETQKERLIELLNKRVEEGNLTIENYESIAFVYRDRLYDEETALIYEKKAKKLAKSTHKKDKKN